LVELTPRKPSLERILRAAVSVFAQRGYDGASLREVAEAAGVTKPTLYNHFGSKASLYEETIRWMHARVIRRLEQAAAGHTSAYERLLSIMQAELEQARQYSDLIRVGHSLLFLPDEVQPCIRPQELFQERFNLLLRVVREGVATGELEGKPEDIALAISSATSSLALAQALMPSLPVFRTAVEERILRVLFHGAKKR